MNLAIITGRLGRDPEIRYTADGTPVASTSVASDSSSKANNYTEWHVVKAWGKTAERLHGLRIGDAIAIQGEIRTDKWERDGEERTLKYILAHRVYWFAKKEKCNQDNEDEIKDIMAHDDCPF